MHWRGIHVGQSESFSSIATEFGEGFETSRRISGSDAGSVNTVPPTNYGTANVINAYDRPNVYAHLINQERSATPPPGRWLSFEFEVEDTGPGIPDELHSKIFEPFVQGDLGLSKKFGGTGLGLSICSQLAGLMKGTIGVKSEMNKGSVFTMAIPLKHVSSRADSTASSRNNVKLDSTSPRGSLSMDEVRGRPTSEEATSVQPSTSGSPNNPAQAAGPVPFETDSQPRLVGLSQPFFASTTPLESPNSQEAAMQRVEAEATQRGQKVKVLVAEDNKTNQEVVLRMLKLEDVYDVTVAKDGQEALDKVKESMEHHAPYNLIFMDVQMPNLDGLQSTRLIRQSGFSSPIVALTAYAEESNVKVRSFYLQVLVLSTNIKYRNASIQAWTFSFRNLSVARLSSMSSKHTVLPFPRKRPKVPHRRRQHLQKQKRPAKQTEKQQNQRYLGTLMGPLLLLPLLLELVTEEDSKTHRPYLP